ncbi:transporter substrate-binding domain-containing protein [Shewanella gelidimarina]|uniref:substrate-binding periplasmic protein n=1 Tax=Shewanella gelidimarina TaxID=56813 RepID=UPI00200DF7AC|nr:transporter substrate-binding domain-containing protein [Shewanella gelidimarina]MCL1057386.1 transporter substrate-binding domain-containing protein [Shewanella gelidimarina]
MKLKLITILCLSFPVQAEQIVIASDIWCPYICTDNSGYLVELTQQAFLTVGVTAKFETIPFKRALRLAQRNRIHAVLAVTSESIKRCKLQTSNIVLGQNTNDFYVHTSNNWQYSTLADLEEKAVASILGYDYGDELNQYLEQSPITFHASGESPLNTNLNLLKKDRVDVLLGNRYVIEHTAQIFGYSKDIKFAGSEGHYTPLYVGFSHKDLEKNYQNKFAEGIENIKQSGQYQAILEKYHIKPW